MVILRPRYGSMTSTTEDVERLIPISSPSSSSFVDESLEEEEEEEDDNNDNFSNNPVTPIQSSIVSVWFGLIVLTLVGVFAMISMAAPHFSSLSTPKKSNFVSKSFVRIPYASTTSGLSVATIWNEYGEFGANGMLSYPFLSGSFLIEPYKLTTINLQGLVEGCTYTYTITSMGTEDTNMNGTIDPTGVLQITLTKVGKYMLQVQDSCTSETLSQTMWVKYVRRELSTLTVTDREEFLDAFHTLWEVNTVDGMAKYGERYKSLYYFAALHNDGGGNSVCDEFHGGVGFLNNHMYLSAYLEQSMQLVNPKVCLHYMEYTKYFTSDGFQKHLTNELDGGGWTELLSSKFFGANDPVSGRITDGRWAMTPIPYLTSEFFTNHGIDPDKTFFPSEEKVWTTLTNPHLNSPYGLLRSPWNYNPDPYVTRFGNVWRVPDTSVITCTCAKCECNEREVVYKYHMGVQCEDYQVFFDSIKRQSLTNYLMLMEDDTHGIFHFTFGGVGGDRAVASINRLIGEYGFSVSNAMALAVSAQPFFKIYLASNPSHYERGGKVYPLNCTNYAWQYKVGSDTSNMGSPGEIGGPQCDFIDSYYVSEAKVNELIQMFFRTDPSPHDSIRTRVLSLSVEKRIEVMKIIANMFPYDGDLAGSGAAQDPLFWVAHGSVERLFQRAVFENVFTDMIYNDGYVFPSYCSGHAGDATKSWLKGFYFVDESIVAETLTNAQLTAYLVPDSDEYRDLINFVYDSGDLSFCPDSNSWFTYLER